jgi:hypothetical protein
MVQQHYMSDFFVLRIDWYAHCTQASNTHAAAGAQGRVCGHAHAPRAGDELARPTSDHLYLNNLPTVRSQQQ